MLWPEMIESYLVLHTVKEHHNHVNVLHSKP